MNRYQIYNKSSENMSEVESNSVDLIYFSPPYNIETKYDTYEDNLPNQRYFDMMQNVIGECYRVLIEGYAPKMIIEVADSVLMNGKYIQLAGRLQKIALNQGFYLGKRDFNFDTTNQGVEVPTHDWNENYEVIGKNAHSNLHQIMTFYKDEDFDWDSKCLYSSYSSDGVHPCPTPKTIVDYVTKYVGGQRIFLDPFMGTGRIGEEVLRKGGNFIGYDVVESYCNEAKRKFDLIINKEK